MRRGDAWACFAGLFSVALAVGVRVSIGTVYSGHEARQLLSSLVDGGLYLASTTTTASATILALMLTVLGFVRRVDEDFDTAWFSQIRWVSILAATDFGLSAVTLLLMSVPVSESNEIPQWWNVALYYTTSAMTVIITGLTVSLVVMLLTAIVGIIDRVAPAASESPD